MARLTPIEVRLMKSLPTPPQQGSIRTNRVLILEWLQDAADEPRTGLELHQILEGLRPGWSKYIRCNTKGEFLRAIAEESDQDDAPRILHLESHGCNDGLGDGSGREFLTWNELNPKLQALNLACRCNLLVFVAACRGFAGISALTQGPRAPAAVLVGPARAVNTEELALASSAFYRELIDGTARLQSICDSSTDRSGVLFEPEPMAILAYEAFVETMIDRARPENREERMRIMRQQLARNGLNAAHAERLMLEFDLNEANLWQRGWNHFFMLDLDPGNATRFGLDVIEIARRIAVHYGRTF